MTLRSLDEIMTVRSLDGRMTVRGLDERMTMRSLDERMPVRRLDESIQHFNLLHSILIQWTLQSIKAPFQTVRRNVIGGRVCIAVCCHGNVKQALRFVQCEVCSGLSVFFCLGDEQDNGLPVCRERELYEGQE